jgi:hypothetical protein
VPLSAIDIDVAHSNVAYLIGVPTRARVGYQGLTMSRPR